MRVIKQGNPPYDAPLQGTCNSCSAVIEFKPREAQLILDNRYGDYYEIDCPCCGQKITKAKE